jgi:hypothetical protein
MRSLGLVPIFSLAFAVGCQTADLPSKPKDSGTPETPVQKLPVTIQEAVETILSRMPGEDQARLRAVRRDDLINDLHSWGRGIRNEFHLWGGNPGLLEACSTDSPERASMVIMEAVWDRLQKK